LLLLVDDYIELLDFFSALLRNNGFDVQTASSRKELDEQMILFTPDLIILDIMLEKENGRDICRDLKRINKRLPIILLSSNPAFLINYDECEADDIIEKPFDINEVVKKIKAVLTKKDVVVS
jgi:DNA-binding response OmpR family regulator